MEKSLIVIKPGAVREKHIGEILSRFEQAGLVIEAIKMETLSNERVEEFYAEHKGKPFYQPLIEHMTSGPVVAVILSGDNAIQRIRDMAGATDASKAEPGTIRRDFSGKPGPPNALHASDSPKSAEREIAFYFGK